MDDVNSEDNRDHAHDKTSELDSEFQKHVFPALFLESKERAVDVLIRKDVVPGCKR